LCWWAALPLPGRPRRRKVRTAQSTLLPNGKAAGRRGFCRKVGLPLLAWRTDSATENIPPKRLPPCKGCEAAGKGENVG